MTTLYKEVNSQCTHFYTLPICSNYRNGTSAKRVVLFANDCFRHDYQMCSLKELYVITYHAFRHILNIHTFSLCEGLIYPEQIQFFAADACLGCRYSTFSHLCLTCNESSYLRAHLKKEQVLNVKILYIK